jgi:hypothetical protein
MAIILSVLRLVFPFYGHYIVCPLPRFSKKEAKDRKEKGQKKEKRGEGQTIKRPKKGKTRRRTENIMAIKRKNEAKDRQYNGHK